MKQRLYIRADGNHQTGLGHLVRCMALAQMLERDFSIAFTCLAVPDKFAEEIRENDFDLITIDEELGFFDRLGAADLVVLDGYHFDSNYQQQVKARGAVLAVIDDLHDQEMFADLVINHAPGVHPSNYTAQSYTQFALGPSYALLRPRFLALAQKKRQVKGHERVLICFGGSDHKNITAAALGVVQTFPSFKEIVVITGAAYGHGEELRSKLGQDTRVRHLHALNETAMAEQMMDADLAIVPSSGILLEALATGVFIVSGMYTDNQKFIYQRYRDANAFVDAADFSSAHLQQAVAKVLATTPVVNQLIDGHSGERFREIFKSLSGQALQLRRATSEDIDITYQWAVNPKVRAYSFSQHQITKAEHTDWFSRKVKDGHCIYFIAEVNNNPVGSIRFDIKGGEAIISYLIDPDFHGRKLGQAMLQKGMEMLVEIYRKESPEFDTITGRVMKSNVPSVKAFERLGFSKIEESDNFKFQKTIS